MKLVRLSLALVVAACSPPRPIPPAPTPDGPSSPLNPGGAGSAAVAVLPEQFVRLGVQERIFLRPVVGGVRAFAFTLANEEQPVDSIETADDSVTVVFTARVRGRIKLRVVNAASELVLAVPLYAVKGLDGSKDFERTFVDRMDTCSEGPFRAKSGRVFCRRNSDIWVYRDDGSIDGHFFGAQLAVTGDEIWSEDGRGFEHRTDLGAGGLRLDGRVDAEIALPYGETRPGVAIRGIKNGLIELTWDGTTLAGRSLSGYPDIDQDAVALVSPGDARPVLARSNAICTVTRGCQQTTCPSLFSCTDPGAGASTGLLGVTATDLWHGSFALFDDDVVDGRRGVLLRTSRDRRVTERLVGIEGMLEFKWLSHGRSPIDSGEVRPVVGSVPQMSSNDRGSVFPDSDESGGFLWHWQHRGTLIGANADFLIAARTPFELTFHPR